MPILKIGEIVILTENTWGIDIVEANIVNIEDIQVDKWNTEQSGTEIIFRDLVIEDETGKCNLRVKMNRSIFKEYIKLLDEKNRIKLVNVGWLINQKRLTTVQGKYEGSEIMTDDEIEKYNKKKQDEDLAKL